MAGFLPQLLPILNVTAGTTEPAPGNTPTPLPVFYPWQSSSPPPSFTGEIYTVHFFDSDTGWIGGTESTDGGQTWPTNVACSNGWAVGDDYNSGEGRIFYTDDGGDTWSLQYNTSNSTSYRAIYFSDDTHGWVVGTNGNIYYYTNTQ